MGDSQGTGGAGGQWRDASAKYAAIQGKAEKNFNREASRVAAGNQTTQHTATQNRSYVLVPSDGIAIPPVSKAFEKAAAKQSVLSKPAPELELTPPGGVTARPAPPSTAEKIDASKIPAVVSRKEKLAERFAAMLKKQRDQSQGHDASH